MTAEGFKATKISEPTPIRPILSEVEVKQSIGVALLIVGLDPNRDGDNTTNPLIWTIKELKDKSKTDKIAGDISIPAETKKIGESKEENILGALAEFADDQSIAYLKDHLFLIGDTHVDKGIIINNNPVDLTVLIYDGALDIFLKPVSSEEVSPNGWVNRDTIQEMSCVRSALRQAIELDRTRGLSARAIDEYYKFPEKRIPIFPKDLRSMNDFHAQRELFLDVSLA